MKLATKIIIPFLILAGGVLLMIAFSSMKKEVDHQPPVQRPKLVSTEVVELQSIRTELGGLGRLVSAQPLELFAEVNGKLVDGDIPYLPGQSFKKGDLLIGIDDRQAKLRLNSKKSELLSAMALVLPEIKSQFSDEFPIWEEYFNSIKFDEAVKMLPESKYPKVRLYLVRSNVYQLFFAVQDLEIELEKFSFIAPFDGAIRKAEKRVGANARSGNLIGSIINLEELEVEVPVTADDIEWIDLDNPIALRSPELGKEMTGRVSRIGGNIDTRTQSVPVYITLNKSNYEDLREGLFLAADIPGKIINDAYKIPRRAIYEESNVYLVNNGKFEYKRVNIVRYTNDAVIINGGLNNGDTLVVDILQGVVPGMLATPIVKTEVDWSN